MLLHSFMLEELVHPYRDVYNNYNGSNNALQTRLWPVLQVSALANASYAL
jgi:hypothetical protein